MSSSFKPLVLSTAILAQTVFPTLSHAFSNFTPPASPAIKYGCALAKAADKMNAHYQTCIERNASFLYYASARTVFGDNMKVTADLKNYVRVTAPPACDPNGNCYSMVLTFTNRGDRVAVDSMVIKKDPKGRTQVGSAHLDNSGEIVIITQMKGHTPLAYTAASTLIDFETGKKPLKKRIADTVIELHDAAEKQGFYATLDQAEQIVKTGKDPSPHQVFARKIKDMFSVGWDRVKEAFTNPLAIKAETIDVPKQINATASQCKDPIIQGYILQTSKETLDRGMLSDKPYGHVELKLQNH
ncbi:MAG: hypothetical protein AB7E52_05605 [Bdellovibrionales bacterium]